MHFLEAVQPDFRGWGDVYFFCGHDFRFCTCALTWNVLGARRALCARPVLPTFTHARPIHQPAQSTCT